MSYQKVLRMTILAAACICLIGIRAGGIEPNPAPVTENVDVSVTYPLSARTIPITAFVGSTFAVRLSANHTTGYQWQPAATPNTRIVQVRGSTYSESRTGRLGRSGIEQWVFRALGKGSVSLTMNYVRPWEKNVRPAKAQTFDVRVE